MRTKFLSECESLDEAKERAPWASVYKPADGGWWAFESTEDAKTWEAQE